jgi:hypothetical protein
MRSGDSGPSVGFLAVHTERLCHRRSRGEMILRLDTTLQPVHLASDIISGLSQKQMYDLTEIWTCMGVLLQPLHGKCIEARVSRDIK